MYMLAARTVRASSEWRDRREFEARASLRASLEAMRKAQHARQDQLDRLWSRRKAA